MNNFGIFITSQLYLEMVKKANFWREIYPFFNQSYEIYLWRRMCKKTAIKIWVKMRFFAVNVSLSINIIDIFIIYSIILYNWVVFRSIFSTLGVLLFVISDYESWSLIDCCLNIHMNYRLISYRKNIFHDQYKKTKKRCSDEIP